MSKKPLPTSLQHRGPTLILRASLLGMSGLVAIFSTMLLVSIYNNWGTESDELAWLRWPLLIGIVLMVGSFFSAGIQAWKLLNLFDKGKAFSRTAVRSLNIIKYCAFTVGVVLASCMPLVYLAAENDDAPGLILVGLGFVAVPWTVAIFAGVLQKILLNAIELKAENDLTV